LATKELAVALQQRTVAHFFCTRELLTKNNMTVVPHPSHFSLFPQLKIKLKGRHFDTIEVIEADSQVVLNIFTEHDFQNALKKFQKRWEAQKGATSTIMVASRLKVSF
jgi:hypothetical protein